MIVFLIYLSLSTTALFPKTALPQPKALIRGNSNTVPLSSSQKRWHTIAFAANLTTNELAIVWQVWKEPPKNTASYKRTGGKLITFRTVLYAAIHTAGSVDSPYSLYIYIIYGDITAIYGDGKASLMLPAAVFQIRKLRRVCMFWRFFDDFIENLSIIVQRRGRHLCPLLLSTKWNQARGKVFLHVAVATSGSQGRSYVIVGTQILYEVCVFGTIWTSGNYLIR